MHFLGFKHKQARKGARQVQNSAYLRFLDKLTHVIGIFGPLTVLPQVVLIYSTQSAEGVSLTTWLAIFLMTLPWILYGLAHKARMVTFSFALWAVFDLLVVIGIVLYG